MTQAPTPGPLTDAERYEQAKRDFNRMRDDGSLPAPTAPVEASGSERDVQGLVRPDAMAGRRWRHKERGTTYTSLGFGKAQCSPSGLLDDENVVIYRGDDGSLWARRHAEFTDGRFEEIEALRPQPSVETRELPGHSVNLGFETDEPTLRQIIEYYYRSHSMPDPMKWADRYVAALSTTPARAEAQDEGAAGERGKSRGQVAYEGWAQGLPGCEWVNQTRTQQRAWEKAAQAVIDAHPSPTPAADADRVRIAVEGLERIKAYRVCKESANIWTGATACRAIAGEALAALKSESGK